jgi:hypothetical protein
MEVLRERIAQGRSAEAEHGRAIMQAEAEAERDLQQARAPVAEIIKEALSSLDKGSLTELKSFGSPGPAIVNVLAAVIILTAGRPKVPEDLSWFAAKKMMRNVGQFLDSLLRFDKDHVDECLVETVEKDYLSNPEFNYDTIRVKSGAAAGLCSWVINICKYFRIYQMLAPKRAALANLMSRRKRSGKTKGSGVQSKTVAELDLAAKQTLDLAAKQMDGITPKDIQGLKALKSPPEIIQRIMDAVLILLQKPLDPVVVVEGKVCPVYAASYENAMLYLLGQSNFLDMLRTFPKENINDETVELLQPYLDFPDFSVVSAAKASGSMAGLCAWCAAMSKYQQTSKTIRRSAEANAEGSISMANSGLKAAVADQCDKWASTVTAEDGRIYCIPFNAVNNTCARLPPSPALPSICFTQDPAR